MQAKSNPLFVIINPPGIQYGKPGEKVEIHVVIRNEGQQSAVVDLFFTFDETFQKISNWSDSPRASLALGSGEISHEVTFELEIPVDALSGTYDYTLVVDSPEHYPQDTPINFAGQVKVLPRENTVIRPNDPVFSIQPATNPNKPLIYKPDRLLQATVKVDNRSNRVDRFRLTCPELDKESLKISYPETGVEAVGLLGVSALELNPASQGQILLEFRPPADTLAGTYSPTIRLHSENDPDLILLDLVYIQIPTDYQIGIELNTILGKVSRRSGKYQLILTNEGNLVRELYFNARTRDEEEICVYKFEPTEVKLLPKNSVEANLTVKPKPWWRRPWIGRPLNINFQVYVKDKQDLPISSRFPQGVLEWKSRPLWQLLLLILLGFGVVTIAGFFIWRMLYPEPLTIENFSTDVPILDEGGKVLLNWKISNYKQLENLEIKIESPPEKEPFVLQITNTTINSLIVPNKDNEDPPCRTTPQEELICEKFLAGEIKRPVKYRLKMEASYPQRHSLFYVRNKTQYKTANVEIKERPIAEVLELNTDKLEYQKGEPIVLNFSIENPNLLERIEVIPKRGGEIPVGQPKSFKFENGTFKKSESKNNKLQLKNTCKPKNNGNRRQCQVHLSAIDVGNFTYELKAYSRNSKDNERISSKSTENQIEVLTKSFKIVSFTLNGNNELNQNLNEGDTATLSWKVEGEDIEVRLLPYGKIVPLIGTEKIKVIENFEEIKLQVTDKSGKREPQTRSFQIFVKTKQPTPNPLNSPSSPASPPRSPNTPRLRLPKIR